MNLSEKAITIINFLRENTNADVTAKDIAESLNIPAPSVNGTITGLQKKGLAVREVVNGIDGKVIRLTSEGEFVDFE